LIGHIEIHGISHITGGGVRNISRLKGMLYEMEFPEIPYIFRKVIEDGSIPIRDAFQTFNMGIGMIIILPKKEVRNAMDELDKLAPQEIGEVKRGNGVHLRNYDLKYEGYY